MHKTTNKRGAGWNWKSIENFVWSEKQQNRYNTFFYHKSTTNECVCWQSTIHQHSYDPYLFYQSNQPAVNKSPRLRNLPGEEISLVKKSTYQCVLLTVLSTFRDSCFTAESETLPVSFPFLSFPDGLHSLQWIYTHIASISTFHSPNRQSIGTSSRFWSQTIAILEQQHKVLHPLLLTPIRVIR